MDLLDDESTPVVIATFELPGVKAKDVRLEVRGDALLLSGLRTPRETTLPPQVREALILRSQAVRGERSSNSPPPTQTHKVSITYELRYGPFRRVIKLPSGVKVSTMLSHLFTSMYTNSHLIVLRTKMLLPPFKKEC
jgi:HSP20 family molecular chaperone IbpA